MLYTNVHVTFTYMYTYTCVLYCRGVLILDGLLKRCPHFRGCYVQASMELGPEDVSLLERCPGCYVQASMELGPEDVSLLERCPHFRGCYVQASMELGPEVSSFQMVLCTGFNGVRTLRCVPIREVSSFVMYRLQWS